ncbi:NAD-dependent epimerase/dehydratase family protein [Streptomyces scabiei]|uniref:NAD-dependent epimerase/dehydratase family protein n=1 Tax=Streptomyces scabiei TaxID=1930 RepID=UPI00249395AD|nr:MULTISPECIES: NAD-dependent epimerase/dehydratase family protein [Streptomyces]MDX2688283.1 NAD(P)H-binding protein [Streptomyces scabiei]MDX2756561.1 NAD(P)H-binding protein [Streptomyces scabiei]MDX2810655.1 NAD(P)H-binding protein [Streptomyces scabiei]MDX3127880.1 NAD(P)H-binding protein [Streptomyces scabiei]MDX3201352.1 NAD(P)H-binding protein [Streptomyces scabiei]
MTPSYRHQTGTSHFVPRLMAQRQPGEQVRVLVRDAARGERFAELGAQVAVGDMREQETLGRALAGVDAVVNVAASFRGVPDEEAWAVNRDAAVALGRAAQALGVERFVQVSTSNVYGVGRGRPLTEEDESRPGGAMWDAYPESKAEAERELLALKGLDVRIGRLPFVYGESDPHLANSLHWAARWAPHQRLQMAHHADVAQGLMRLLYAPGIAGRIYNIADDAPVTTVELYQLNGVKVPAGLHELTDPDPWFGITSNQRIRRELGYRPIYPSVWTARDAGAL